MKLKKNEYYVCVKNRTREVCSTTALSKKKKDIYAYPGEELVKVRITEVKK